MGAYLNKPVIEKEKEEGNGEGFSYACTTMQGWRANQEDAHNCVVDLHKDWHMFAVYDGHGGTEVAKFTSAKFPDFLKNRKFWEAENIGDCLQTAFVEFDDHIRSEDSMKELKGIANEGQKKSTPGNDSEDEADRIDTIEESAIPITELLKRYGGARVGKSLLSAFLAKGDTEEDESEEDEDEEEAEEVEETDEEIPAEEGEKEEEQPEEGEEKKKKVQKRCSKSPIQSEAKKSKSEENAASSSSAEGQPDATTEEDEEDEDDQDFVAPEEEEEDAEDEEEEDDSDDEMEVAGAPGLSQFLTGGSETPGEDSGTTACVCLVGKDKIVVANAGDSRAVLSRAGKAVDLSVDHKPEDQVETDRIHKAGGVIEEGRVNGGLNLSRALGDHAYKKNHALELKEQMITAFPDVKIEPLTPEDEFLIVACDGIWNSMESQQVVDFVSGLIAKGKTCSEICDALCDECLADSTDGDGTGCDNMTVICTIFKR